MDHSDSKMYFIGIVIAIVAIFCIIYPFISNTDLLVSLPALDTGSIYARLSDGETVKFDNKGNDYRLKNVMGKKVVIGAEPKKGYEFDKWEIHTSLLAELFGSKPTVSLEKEITVTPDNIEAIQLFFKKAQDPIVQKVREKVIEGYQKEFDKGYKLGKESLLVGRIIKCKTIANYEKGKNILAVVTEDVCQGEVAIIRAGTMLSCQSPKIDNNILFADEWIISLNGHLDCIKTLLGTLNRITVDTDTANFGVNGIPIDKDGSIPVGTKFLINTTAPFEISVMEYGLLPEKRQLPFGFIVSCVLTSDMKSGNLINAIVSEDIYFDGKLVYPSGTEVHGTYGEFSRNRVFSSCEWIFLKEKGAEPIPVKGSLLEKSNDLNNGTLGMMVYDDGTMKAGKSFFIMTN